MFRTQKYRLYPTTEQAADLTRFADAVRFVYNLALEQRRDFSRQFMRDTGRTLNYASQGKQLTDLRRQVPWLADVPACCQHGALQDLDKAFARFFKGGGFPKFRRAGVNDSFEVRAADTAVRSLNAKWSQVRIPKLGWVKFRDSRPIKGEMRSTRMVYDDGKWFVCIGIRDDREAPASSLPAVGIDRGVALAIALSNGHSFTVPDALQSLDKRARRKQRQLHRRKRGSRRFREQGRRLSAVRARAKRVRCDWQHKSTSAIVQEFGTVAIEALRTKHMTRRGAGKRGLNRVILNVGWYGIERMLAYKLEQRGGTLIKVNPAYTSQTCAECGTVDRESRESQARFICRGCGHTDNADVNAARNILRQGLAGVEGDGYVPVEARTTQPRLAA